MLQASSSTGVVKPSVDSVKKVPTFLPPIIVLMAFSCIPLHITTLTPRSKAQVAALTFESIPPVPTYSDNNSNTERRFIVETEEVTKSSSCNLSTCSISDKNAEISSPMSAVCKENSQQIARAPVKADFGREKYVFPLESRELLLRDQTLRNVYKSHIR
uniref:Uncharacterized protein n=1 Tax=Glossina pallidipes TaxID=7398 RepID=A0A1B0AE18_GLOPL